MKTILTVIKKELLDTLRDKRTLVSAIVLPALIIPVILLGVTKLQKSIIKKERNKTLKVALIEAPDNMRALFSDTAVFKLQQPKAIDSLKSSISKGNLDAALVFNSNFTSNLESLKTGQVDLYFKSTNLLVEKRIKEKIEGLEKGVVNERLKQLNITSETLDPIIISKHDVASAKEQIGKKIGGLIPYLFIILCFTGCMYPTLDLITGEKERGTLETLLTVPASRFKILIGKMITISIIGLSAAIMTITGMFISLKFIDGIPPEFLSTIQDMLGFKFIAMLFAMLIPLSIFFAGGMSALVIKAKSFKEAQSIVTPLTFIVIVPAMIAMMPGVELNWQTVWIPILNIALATKEIIAGTIDSLHYGVIVFSLIILALISVFISYKQFSKESMVLK